MTIQKIDYEALFSQSVMQLISNPVKVLGAFLSLSLVSLGISGSLKNILLSSYAATQLVFDRESVEEISQQLAEKAWGNVGALAYQAGNQLMANNNANNANNAKHQGLDAVQKQYLRPHFGDLVDRVEVVYSAVLMEDWVAASFKINLGESNAQVYGDRIYIKDIYRPGDLNQIVLLAHELYHCKQYEELGSLSKFGYHYFFQYKKADENYKQNIFEQEAFTFEDYFTNWLAEEVVKPVNTGKTSNGE